MSPVLQGVTFPDLGWLPDPQRLNNVGTDVMAVAFGALEQQGVHERYTRTYLGHGTKTPVEKSRDQQLTVVLTRVYPGRAGEEQFQFVKGAGGKLAFQTASFLVELSAPWPVRQGTAPISTVAIAESRTTLWRDALIVWAAFIGLSLGGVRAPHIASHEDVTVSALLPRDPGGGQASWVTTVEVQL